MKSGFPLFLRLVRLTFFHSKGTFARLTPKRFLIMVVVVSGLLVGKIVHSIGFLIDNIFFRGYRSVEVKEPVFIVGIPRSGTTFLHRLLAKDADNFTTFDLWEMILAPSIIERKVLMALGKADRALGGLGRKLVGAIDHRMFASVRKMHRTSLFGPEEDEMILLFTFGSVFLLFPFPFPDELMHLTRFDEDTPAAEKKRIMAYYKACVQRHLYVHGADKRLLSKNPCYSSKIDALDATFPDAKVVCSVRNPCEAIPSLLSLLSLFWSQFDNERRQNEWRDIILEIAGHYYRYPADRLPHWPEDRHAFLTYDVLTREPHKAVVDLYNRLGLEMSPAYAARLEAEQEKARAYKSKHAYSLEEYDLTRETVAGDFSDVMERYGFE